MWAWLTLKTIIIINNYFINVMDFNPASENSRLRKELKTNKTAYAKLNNEKDEAIKVSVI